MTKYLVLKLAMVIFSLLPVEQHGVCRVDSVHREGAYKDHWWACGSCYYKGGKWEGSYLAVMLLHCSDGSCSIVTPTPKGADLGTCEREMGRKR